MAEETQKTRKWPKLLIPVVILLLVAGVWLIKNLVFEEAEKDMSPYALDATYSFNLAEILSHGLPVMIDFGSDSCLPCLEMAPVLKKMNTSLRGQAVIKYVNVGKNPAPAQDFPVKVVPTQLFFDRNGKPYVPQTNRISGFTQYSSKDTGEHILTAHEGGLTEIQILFIFKEMGLE